MKILLTTSGSRGDVQPLLALADALKAAGHRVVLAAPPENRTWAARCGCRFAEFGERFDTVLNRLSDAHTPRAAVHFVRFIRRDINRQFGRLPGLVAGIDLMLAASLSFASASFAEKHRIPYGFIGFCPQILPSRYHPPPTIPFGAFSPGFNRLFWFLDRIVDSGTLRPLINRHRRRLQLPPIAASLPYILGHRVLLASDPVLAAPPADAAPRVDQTGAWQLAPQDRLSTSIQKFIARGSPPVYIGFGSMPHRDISGLLPVLKEAIRPLGHRLFIRVGPSLKAQHDRDVYVHSGNLPHSQLFGRMAAVVHHGGAGTTATAARAGVPQVIIPHVLDQFFWARRIHALGLGPKPIWRSRLTAGKLQAAILQAVENHRYRLRAEEIAREIKSAVPLQAAVKIVRQLHKESEK